MQTRIVVQNDAPVSGLVLSPFFVGLDDGSFDLFDIGEQASPGLEQLAEDGLSARLEEEFATAPPQGQAAVLDIDGGDLFETSNLLPFLLSEVTLEVDPQTQGTLSFAASVLPSNDAFIGSADGIELFDEEGKFLGEQNIQILGEDVLDAGTEFNTELDAALINQTEPNTGIDSNGVVGAHPGFNGSVGNPISEGQVILGGTFAIDGFAVDGVVDPIAADFTLPDTEVATVHVNVIAEFEGSPLVDVYTGGAADDLVNGNDGNDVLVGAGGWDVMDGGADEDILIGGEGNDILLGGAGDDLLYGGAGNDLLAGGAGADVMWGGAGDDGWEVSGGIDTIMDFESGQDVLMIFSDQGIGDFDSVLAASTDGGGGVTIDLGNYLGEPTQLILPGQTTETLVAEDFIFL